MSGAQRIDEIVMLLERFVLGEVYLFPTNRYASEQAPVMTIEHSSNEAA